MRIDIKAVIDYAHCPRMYRLKYLGDIEKRKKISIIEKYDDDIHRAIYSIFHAVQNKDNTTIKDIMRTWGMLWIGSKTTYEIVYCASYSWGVIENEKRKLGIETLIAVFNSFKDNPGNPLVVNHQYQIPITDKIILTGTWELIREVDIQGMKQIEIIDFKNNDKMHNKISVNKDIELTAQSCAFRNTFQIKEDALIYYGLDKRKLHITNRSEKDFKLLYHTVEGIVYAIQRQLFYAIPDGKCYTCPYRLMCEATMDCDIIKRGESNANANRRKTSQR